MRKIVHLHQDHKRGDAFAFGGFLKVTSVAGTPMIAPPAVRAQVRTRSGVFVDELLARAGEYVPGHGYLVTLYKKETQTWPVDWLEFDVEMTFANGHVRSSLTVRFECVRDKTFGAPAP